MPEHDLRSILDDIARKEIPDDMNLWNEIEHRIASAQLSRASRTALGLSRVAVLVLAILIAGTVYAVYQVVTQRGGDPGIQAVSDLITDLNLTQRAPDEDISVTLQWAYADGHRIAVAWQVEHAASLIVPYPAITLLDAEGNLFGHADFLYGGGGGGGGRGERMMFGTITSYDATGIEGAPDSLSLTMRFGFEPAERGVGPEIGMPSGENAPIPTLIQEAFDLTFEFDVPFIPAQPIEQDFTAEAAGIEMTLNVISYAPSATLATLCYDSPEPDVLYTPHFVTDGSPFGLTAFYTRNFELGEDGEPLPMEDPIICGDVTSFQTPDPETGILTITVDSLHTALNISEETIAELQARIEEEGLPFRIAPIPPEDNPKGILGMNVQTVEPFGYSEDAYLALDRLQTEVMTKSVSGPWVFEIPIGE